MTKHSKNSTARPVYTYHERKKDTRESKYGTRTTRLGADSHTPLDCCEISLQPARFAIFAIRHLLSSYYAQIIF